MQKVSDILKPFMNRVYKDIQRMNRRLDSYGDLNQRITDLEQDNQSLQAKIAEIQEIIKTTSLYLAVNNHLNMSS
ncbi:MAG: hypothetical protein ACFFG0_57215 [Candidatus Thorarchaeota archaeon]